MQTAQKSAMPPVYVGVLNGPSREEMLYAFGSLPKFVMKVSFTLDSVDPDKLEKLKELGFDHESSIVHVNIQRLEYEDGSRMKFIIRGYFMYNGQKREGNYDFNAYYNSQLRSGTATFS